jgi:hypothetical protein
MFCDWNAGSGQYERHKRRDIKASFFISAGSASIHGIHSLQRNLYCGLPHGCCEASYFFCGFAFGMQSLQKYSGLSSFPGTRHHGFDCVRTLFQSEIVPAFYSFEQFLKAHCSHQRRLEAFVP